MVEGNGEFRTTETPLAAYLIQEGFALLIIEYSPKPNDKQQATFVFDESDPKLRKHINLYNTSEAEINLARYEHVRVSLLNRIKRGLP